MLGARRSYAKGRASQEKILDTALVSIAQKGYGSTSLTDIADQVGMTSAGLLHHFGSREKLYVEVLRRRDAVDDNRLIAPGHGSVPGILQVVKHNVTVPGLIQLFVSLSADATDSNHPGHEYFRERYILVHHRLCRDIEIRQQGDRFNSGVRASDIATMLIALSDGLQERWAADPSSVDLVGTLLTFWNYFAKEKLTDDDLVSAVALLR